MLATQLHLRTVPQVLYLFHYQESKVLCHILSGYY